MANNQQAHARLCGGETSVRFAEDLESSALTYAEIKAIASGNPVLVEKIQVDTEIRSSINCVRFPQAGNAVSDGKSVIFLARSVKRRNTR
jgi:hypothetical protein